MRNTLRTSASAALIAAGVFGGFTGYAHADQDTSGAGGVGSGNQINVPANVEAELCGNALAALGISAAECEEVSRALYASSEEGGNSQSSDGSGGVASGNQINIPVDVALDVCGNSASVIGIASGKCTTVVEGLAESEENSQSSDGSGGVASGNQINIPVDVALDVCGNSASVIGVSSGECTTVVEGLAESEENSQSSDGSGGVASGNQINVPVDAAVEICGNAVSVLGVAEAECMRQISDDSSEGDDGSDGEDGSNGSDGDNGDDGSDGSNGDDGSDGEKGEDDPNGEDSGGDDHQAPENGDPGSDAEGNEDGDAEGGLPVTGAALGGLVAAAAAALAGGGAAMYLTRRRKAAALADESPAEGQE